MRSTAVVFRPLALAFLGTLLLGGTGGAGVVYSNDFESNTAGFDKTNRFTLPTTGDPATPTSKFLGKFGNDAVNLSLTGLTAGQLYSVQFDLFTGASWDGSYGSWSGPDVFKLKAGSETLVDASFARANTPVNGVEPLRQSYSDTTWKTGSPYTATEYARTGADVKYSHPSDIFQDYSIYYFGHGAGNPYLAFTAGGSNVTLTFTGRNLQGLSDEFWAIDNVVVAAVPEPSSIAMSLIGLVAAGAFARRRARG
jgi:hypothetical protein